MKQRFVLILSIFFLILANPALSFAQASVKESDQLDFAQGLLSRGMYDMAISQYQKFISDYPKSSSLQEAYLSLGEGYFLSQDFNDAENAFNQFRKLFPTSDQLPVSVLRLGQIDIQQKKFDDALKELTSIDVQRQLKGAMLQSFDFYIAEAFLGKSDTASALEFFQKATQVEGASGYTAYAFEEVGKIQAQNGQYAQALDAYAKSMPLAQDDALKGELIYRTAEVDFLSGKYADAVKAFGQVIDQYPSLEFAQDALANMLVAYNNLGEYDQSLSEYQKYIKRIKDEEAYFAIHFVAVEAYIELKEYDKANELLDRMVAFPSLKSSERAKIFVKKADILIREKKFKDGLALLDAYASENADNADENFFLKAQAYFGMGDYDHAFNFFENVYQNFPDSRFLRAALLGEAHARKEMGRYKESEVLFLKYYSIQDEPKLKSEALYNAVMTAVQAGDIAQAVKSAQEYLKTFPDGENKEQIMLVLADSYGKNNRFADAVKLLQDYLAKPELVQKTNAVYFLLGYSEQSLGQNDQALAAYTKIDGQQDNGDYYMAALKNMAIIDLAQGKSAQARIYFDRLISQTGQNDLQLKTYIWVCNENLKEQQFDDVLRIATQAEKKFPPPDLLEIEYFKAEALRGLSKCDEAFESYNLVTASAVKNAYTGSAHIGNGLCMEKTGKFDAARAEFQKALDENADDYTVTVHARFELANMEVSQGNLDDALKLYLLIATIYDDNYFCSESLLRAAKIDEQLKRKDDALKLYSEILDKYNKSEAAVYARGRVGFLK